MFDQLFLLAGKHLVADLRAGNQRSRESAEAAIVMLRDILDGAYESADSASGAAGEQEPLLTELTVTARVQVRRSRA